MCRFIESIQLRDGKFMRLSLHQERVCKTMSDFYPKEIVFDLKETLSQATFPCDGLFKCRIVYDSQIRSLEFTPYKKREINSLRLVETQLESSFCKKEDRSLLNAAFALRRDCDDIILLKNGLLTDSSFSNIAFFDGLKWYTPRIPLIYGVNRTQLVSEGVLIEKDLTTSGLMNFQRVSLFNAMNEFGSIELDISAIRQ